MEVYFSKKANNRYLEICDLIEAKWGTIISNKFSNKLLSFSNTLSEFPLIGTIENPDNSIRGFQLTKQTKVFYKIYKNKILIVNLFDVRQNPKNIKK